MTLATVGLDEIWELYSLLPWVGAVVMAVFLLAAIRMSQAAPGRGERMMGIGFGLLVVAMIYEGALQAGVLVLNYYPGSEEWNFELSPVEQVEWWEPLAWWGNWAVLLSGWGLAALGMFVAGRRIASEARMRDLQPLPGRKGHA